MHLQRCHRSKRYSVAPTPLPIFTAASQHTSLQLYLQPDTCNGYMTSITFRVTSQSSPASKKWRRELWKSFQASFASNTKTSSSPSLLEDRDCCCCCCCRLFPFIRCCFVCSGTMDSEAIGCFFSHCINLQKTPVKIKSSPSGPKIQFCSSSCLRTHKKEENETLGNAST